MNLTQKMVILCHAYLDGECDSDELRQNLKTLFSQASRGEVVIFANHNEDRELVSVEALARTMSSE